MLYFLPLIGLFMKVAGHQQGLGPTVLALLVCAVLVFISLKLGFATWRIIGPVPRSLLRPIGVLGPLPVAVVTFFAAVFLYAQLAVATGMAPPAKPKPAAGVTTPTAPVAAAPEPPKVELKLLEAPLPKERVADACTFVSFEWQLATAEELKKTGDAIAAAHKNLSDVKYVWVQTGNELAARPIRCTWHDCSVDLKAWHSGPDTWVVCSRPAPPSP
jgi:hypothetical protein